MTADSHRIISESQAQSWVLWDKVDVCTDQPRCITAKWNLIAAYPSCEICFSRIKPTAEIHMSFFRDHPDVESVDGMAEGIYAVNYKSKKPLTLFHHLQCLPDTVDPRK